MASVQEQLSHAVSQLRDMSLSQRVAVGLGVVLIAGSLAWLTHWAAAPEMTALLPMDLAPDDLARVRAGLERMNEPFQVSGSKVLVRKTANSAALLAQLQMTDSMPADTSTGFAQLAADANPWISQEENNRRWTLGLMTELGKVMRQMSGVRDAHVFLNISGRSGFSRVQPEISASVTLTMKGNEPVPRKLALSAASLVSGAVRGLMREKVQVIDGGTGQSAIQWEDEGAGSVGGLHRLQAEKERMLETKIAHQLDFDPRVRINVQVQLDHKATDKIDRKVTDGPVKEEKTITKKMGTASPSGQPGAQANVGAVAASGGGGEFTDSEETQSTHEPSEETTTTRIEPGDVQAVTAAINLSYSYLAGVWKKHNGADKEPKKVDIEAVFKEQETRIQGQIAKLMVPPKPEQVAISWYDDIETLPGVTAPGTTSTADTGAVDMAMRYAPVTGLGVLSALALAMMLRMAKRSDVGESFGLELGLPKEAVEAARRAKEDIHKYKPRVHHAQHAEGDGVSTAGPQITMPPTAPIPWGAAADGVLVAQEVGEDMVQVNNMLAQVDSVVATDDQGVAAIVESWIDQSK